MPHLFSGASAILRKQTTTPEQVLPKAQLLTAASGKDCSGLVCFAFSPNLWDTPSVSAGCCEHDFSWLCYTADKATVAAENIYWV